jgi:hypothetical protein
MVKHVVLIVWKKSFHPKYICYKICVTSHGYFVMNFCILPNNQTFVKLKFGIVLTLQLEFIGENVVWVVLGETFN